MITVGATPYEEAPFKAASIAWSFYCSAKTGTFLLSIWEEDPPVDSEVIEDGNSFPDGVYPYSAFTVVF